MEVASRVSGARWGLLREPRSHTFITQDLVLAPGREGQGPDAFTYWCSHGLHGLSDGLRRGRRLLGLGTFSVGFLEKRNLVPEKEN